MLVLGVELGIGAHLLGLPTQKLDLENTNIPGVALPGVLGSCWPGPKLTRITVQHHRPALAESSTTVSSMGFLGDVQSMVMPFPGVLVTHATCV